MPVICPVCQTENRDAAKFCHGCARKLPGFAATGPSVLDIMRLKRPAAGSLPARDPSSVASQNAPRGFWIGLGAIMLAVAIGFGGWFGYVTRKVPARAQVAAPVAVAQPQPRQAPAEPGPPAPVPLGSSLAAGEAEVAAVAPSVPREDIAPPLVPHPAPAAPLARRTPAAPSPTVPRSAALDPRQGCQHLNFFAAARCEAAHCDQAAYARHPRCDAVREDRRRDLARRNPTLGT
ncbi:hypothetical protein [Variovorax saccharolyticus]|uniref:hypothetical protein n=1 Tax=Variovorax saccharolyticus TaxID=3053516 RepID=UPI002576B534|nr:hypothetical protein [Variovorax sp. J31P216]MDM0023236.1 hypothetical protein [Variovorax sp. J31P216]